MGDVADRLVHQAVEAMEMAEAVGGSIYIKQLETPIERKYVLRELPGIAKALRTSHQYVYYLAGRDVGIRRLNEE
ncbi:hypothetical protein CMI41_02715 [Candidatus Pacearchaeota archaeon]|nr:hypothetical protein [Candidatus Pacearchaeota archaeon]